MKQIYHLNFLTGGIDSTYLDYADGNSLSEDDRAYVIYSDTYYVYRLDATSGAAESSPNIIAPDTNAGTKRWRLITSYSLTSVTTSVTAADNTSSTAIATTAFAKSQDAVLARDPDQGVALTAAASGSSGITVADDDNIDFATGNFSMVWKGSLTDWTRVSTLLNKYENDSNRVILEVNADGTFSAIAMAGGVTIFNKASTIANTLTDNTCHEIRADIVRETLTVAGSVTFYVDGALFGSSVTIATASTASISNAGTLYILGDNATRTAGTVTHAYLGNFAPTAAEVLDMYRNGPPESLKWGSQTSLITGNDSTFAGAGNWVNDTFTTWDVNSTVAGKAYGLLSGAGTQGWAYLANKMVVGKRYRGVIKARLNAGSAIALRCGNVGGAATEYFTFTPTGTEGVYTGEFSPTVTANLQVGCYGVSANSSAYEFDDITLVEIGLTACYLPEGIQSDKWYDASSNSLTANYPTTGWTLTRPKSKQDAPTAETTAVTLTIAKLLTGVITATHAAGATQAYTLPTGALCDAWPAFGMRDYFDWALINLSAAALDTVTVTSPGADHTIVGNPIVQSANAATGGVMGSSAMFRTVKTAASTFITYRIS